MSDLFRQQALDHQRQRLYGSILLARPLSFAVLTTLFVGIGILIVCFLTFFGFTRKETVQGVLLPDKGIVVVAATQTGTIKARRVHTGQAVKAGQVLFTLDIPQAQIDGASAQAAVERTLQARRDSLDRDRGQQQDQAALQAQTLRTRQGLLIQQLSQLNSEITLARQQVDLAQASVDRFVSLGKSQLVSQIDIQKQQAALIEQQSRVASLERNRIMVQQDIRAAEAELAQSSIQSEREQAAIERNVQAMDQDLAVNRSQTQLSITAPVDGVVGASLVDVGQTISSGQAVLNLLPEGSTLEAELYAPSRSIGFIQPGTVVLLRYQAFPYQKFGQYRGVVREVSDTAIPPNQVSSLLTKDPTRAEAVYRLRVRLDKPFVQAYGKQQPLKAGMQVEAGLVLEDRKIYEWILDPLYSVVGRLR